MFLPFLLILISILEREVVFITPIQTLKEEQKKLKKDNLSSIM